MKLEEEIKAYIPYNEQEEKDKELMLQYIHDFPDTVLTRKNQYGHFSSSAWILNKERTKMLMIYHNIFQSWTWSGGHADGEENLMECAIREAKEETGIQEIKPILEDIFSLEIIHVQGHFKRGQYVSAHVHINVTYVFEVDENQHLQKKEDENSGVKWIPIEEVINGKEPWMDEFIYKKLENKLKEKNIIK